ncbi:hypothetical protein [Actinoplanes utahensis]|uniref:hypothetical protein n=1 Tax=Actinoplanes utahensis TaxID=1869 RepID=UPI000ABF7882|nr:hypothetical protein [Actinoplanes utahensis]GIF30671.1 hypothetical protein Aut01nite_36570 [Actinoplanes utahensis]
MWGAQTMVLATGDGRRQLSVAMNLVRWNRPGGAEHPIDAAPSSLYRTAMAS